MSEMPTNPTAEDMARADRAWKLAMRSTLPERNFTIHNTRPIRKRRKFTQSLSHPGHMLPVDVKTLTAYVRGLVNRNARFHDADGNGLVSRNSPCPCGSDKRFKRCCMFDHISF